MEIFPKTYRWPSGFEELFAQAKPVILTTLTEIIQGFPLHSFCYLQNKILNSFKVL